MRKRSWIAVAIAAEVALFVACGARTELPGFDVDGSGSETEGGDDPDAGRDAARDVARDPDLDVPPDRPPPPDGLVDCDPEARYVYLVTSQTILYRYDPATNGFFNVGALVCPSEFQDSRPFSMGVDRQGNAYVVYDSGELFFVDVNDASCDASGFQIGQEGFQQFGMGFAIDDDGMGETLYVVEISFTAPSLGLGTIDTQTLVLEYIGPLSENFGFAMELTSSDDGQLYGYMLDADDPGGHLLRLDKTSGFVLDDTPLAIGSTASALAFAYWGGDFYVFTAAQDAPTSVDRYRPSDGSVVQVATLAETVVGAGVSTCTPGP